MKKPYYLAGRPAKYVGLNPAEIVQSPAVLVNGDTIAANAARQYIHPVMSGILGPQMSSYLPLSAMNQAGDILLQLTLASAVKAVEAAAGENNYTVTNVAYVAHIITLDEAGDRRVMDAFSGGQLAINTESWYAYTDTSANGATSANILIGARYASLKTIFTLMQSDADVIAAANRSTGGFIRAQLNYYQYRLGGVLFPGQPITAPYESYAELLKAFQGMVNPETTIGIPLTNYDTNTVIVTIARGALPAEAAAANVNALPVVAAADFQVGWGLFGIGVSLEAFSSRTGLILNGLDTRSSTVHVELTLNVGNAFVADVSSICHFDKLLLIDQQSGATMKLE
jgi:hypothetical protein